MSSDPKILFLMIYYTSIAISYLYSAYKFYSLYKEKIDTKFPNPLGPEYKDDGSISFEFSWEKEKKYYVIFKRAKDKDVERYRIITLTLFILFIVPMLVDILR